MNLKIIETIVDLIEMGATHQEDTVKLLRQAIKDTKAQPQEANNFCPRCGKRTSDPTAIHTCTPPRGLEMT